jgi:hypothetical protein
MRAKRGPRFDIATGLVILLYIIIIIIFLKLLGIIPDPPEMLDILMNIAVAIAGTLIGWGIKFFRDLATRLENLEKTVTDEIRDLKTEIAHLRDYLDLSTRVARLEASQKKK